ncbi:MAG: DsbA family protein [Burkholderiales bacterium]
MSVTKPIEFYFDFSSPYGYLASTRIDALAAKHARTVVWRPVLLGAVFKVTAQQPLASIPVKGEYAKRDFERSARYLGVPFRLPSKFPVGTIAPARAFYWIDEKDSVLARRYALAIYQAYFVNDRDISSPEVAAEVAATLGLAKSEVAAALNDPAVKDRLRREGDEALARGVFGSPYIVVDGEPFWGADRLDQVDRWLATGGW